MPDLRMTLRGWSAGEWSCTEQLSQVGDFRRGSLNVVCRKCGKPNCACAQPGHPGHGPQYNLTRSAGGQDGDPAAEAGPGAGEGPRGRWLSTERFPALSGQMRR